MGLFVVPFVVGEVVACVVDAEFGGEVEFYAAGLGGEGADEGVFEGVALGADSGGERGI